MSDLDTCTMGAATLNSVTNVVTVEVSRETGVDDEFEPEGTASLIQCLGVTSLPLGPSKDGHAEGVMMSPCGSYTVGIIGGNDTRCADVYGEMLPGDTCLHSTGSDSSKRARVFCKENSLSLLVGNDVAFVMDRENNAISLAAFGHDLEITKENGLYMAEKGGASFRLSGGKATLSASSLNLAGAVSIGNAASMPPAMAVPLLSYLTALEVLVGVIAPLLDTKLPPVPPPAPSNPATIALTAFMTATAALKAAIPAIFTKVT